MWGLCNMLTYTCFQRSLWSTASQKAKLRKQSHTCLIRFLSATLIGSNVIPEVLFQRWLVKSSLSFPAIFIGLVSLLTWLNGVNMCSAMKSDKKKKIKNHQSQWQMNKLFHRINFGNPAACISVPNSMQLKPDTCESVDCIHTHHDWFSFAAWFIGFDVLHKTCTVRWIILPTTTPKNSKFAMHWINTLLLSFAAGSGCHSKDCAELPHDCSLSDVLSVK